VAPRGGLRDEAFSGVTGERAPSFRVLSVGESAALSLSKGMRRGQNSPIDKSQKRPARSLGTKEKVPALSSDGPPCKHFSTFPKNGFHPSDF
jgi:hypothetical protein